jgi:hypothetical protein
MRAFGAMLLALHDRNWTVGNMDAARPEIQAKMCYQNDPRYCATVLFTNNNQGQTFVRPQYAQIKVQDDLEKWLVALEQAYSKYRCYTDEALRAELNKYGIAL